MKKTRLFVIDDNKNLVDMIKEYFKDSPDIRVTLDTTDGAEAERLIESKQDEYDMILLDLIMPNKDGLSILEQLESKRIAKKVIIITSYNTQDMIRKVSEMGVSYFMLKPFELADLENRIKEVAEGIVNVSYQYEDVKIEGVELIEEDGDTVSDVYDNPEAMYMEQERKAAFRYCINQLDELEQIVLCMR